MIMVEKYSNIKLCLWFLLSIQGVLLLLGYFNKKRLYSMRDMMCSCIVLYVTTKFFGVQATEPSGAMEGMTGDPITCHMRTSLSVIWAEHRYPVFVIGGT